MGSLRNVTCLATYEMTERLKCISLHLFYVKTGMLQHSKTKLLNFNTTLVFRLFVTANGLLRGSVISAVIFDPEL
jgi:hypothetical protein